MAVLSSMSCATAKIDLALYFKVLTAFLSKYSTLCNIREQVHQHILIGLGYHFGDVSFSEQNTHSFIFFINRMTENMRSGSMRQRTNVDRFRLQFSSSSLKLLSTHHISPSPWIIHLPESPRKLCYTFPQIIGQTRNKRRLTEANLIILVCRLPNSNFRKEAYLSKKLHALFVCPMCFMCSYNLTNLYFIYFCQIIFRSGLSHNTLSNLLKDLFSANTLCFCKMPCKMNRMWKSISRRNVNTGVRSATHFPSRGSRAGRQFVRVRGTYYNSGDHTKISRMSLDPCSWRRICRVGAWSDLVVSSAWGERGTPPTVICAYRKQVHPNRTRMDKDQSVGSGDAHGASSSTADVKVLDKITRWGPALTVPSFFLRLQELPYCYRFRNNVARVKDSPLKILSHLHACIGRIEEYIKRDFL